MTVEAVQNDPFQEARWRQNDIESFGLDAMPINQNAQMAGADLDLRESTNDMSLCNKFEKISFKH